jgi:hypothetical protein
MIMFQCYSLEKNVCNGRFGVYHTDFVFKASRVRPLPIPLSYKMKGKLSNIDCLTCLQSSEWNLCWMSIFSSCLMNFEHTLRLVLVVLKISCSIKGLGGVCLKCAGTTEPACSNFELACYRTPRGFGWYLLSRVSPNTSFPLTKNGCL